MSTDDRAFLSLRSVQSPREEFPLLSMKKKKKNSWHLIPSVMKEARLIVFSVSKIHKNMDYRVFIWKKKK